MQDRLGKASKVSFCQSMKKSMEISTVQPTHKYEVCQNCVLTLLYCSQYWRRTERDINKLSSFPTSSLQKILPIQMVNGEDLSYSSQRDMATIKEVIKGEYKLVLC